MAKDFAFRNSTPEYNEKHPKYSGHGTQEFSYKGGDTEGKVRVIPKDEGKTLEVGWFGKEGGKVSDANTLGVRHVRNVLRSLKSEFPKAERLRGERTSGARMGPEDRATGRDAGNTAGVSVNIKLK